ncbi:hypothetical protein L228DRAFT_257451 [Xylona heveae TC161]|uniref:Uncharacterized protein n=1 Tax=Xylona heveae (strain CBS 132557 / TC161) TaxID=1328760 RepID=A0A165J9L1_XYLHT|nr:hypothetical protein L228DRAFT_257451 [Xylona heveae TC161]KZF25937.1 hypothetical protein L228DRAFT_257451 [Xylona heveae TC161]
MRHPLQCIQLCHQRSDTGGSLLLAAAGPRIYLYNVDDGALLCSWPEISPSTDGKNAEFSPEAALEQGAKREAPESEEGPPGKRRKVSSSADAKVEDADRKAKSPPATELPAVSIVSQSPDGKYVVVVTSEDKAIRVFELLDGSTLNALSTRCMPKRPSSVIVTSDSTILCADKFGDVYSLPLLESEIKAVSNSEAEKEGDISESREEVYVPAATHLTVHTARNRMALENQMRMANKQVEKTGPSFAHDPIIGHVSMLTDMTFVTLEAEDGKRRNYILTADRDEHIRISRAPPQAHIIEKFCFGHREFVSKLCLPRWQPTRLVSGGGDDCLFVWDWLNGKLKQRIDLRPEVATALQSDGESKNTKGEPLQQKSNIAVSGIWDVSISNATSGKSEEIESPVRLILVACEGVPVLFSFSWIGEGIAEPPQFLNVEGNILDVAVLPNDSSIFITIDSSHKASSLTELREDETVPGLKAFGWSAQNNAWTKTSKFNNILETINGSNGPGTEVSPNPKKIRELIYGIENLRKRGYEE